MPHLMLPPAQLVHRRAYKPVLIQLTKAHAIAYLLAAFGSAAAGALSLAPEETRAWLQGGCRREALNEALAMIERAYRKRGTNLLEKAAAEAAVKRLLRIIQETPQDGA